MPASIETIPSEFASWISAVADGDADLERILSSSVSRFRLRHGSVFLEAPAPGVAALARVFRGAVVLFGKGYVRSAEMFRVRDPHAFLGNAAERKADIDAAPWDDRASPFTELQPSRMVRDVPTGIDHSGAAAAAAVQDQVRLLEYFLNSDLRSDARAGSVLNLSAAGNMSAHRSLLPKWRDALVDAMKVISGTEASAVLEAFRSRLEPVALETMAKSGVNGIAAYNWLAGYRQGDCDPALSRRRRQAARAYPLAWQLLAAPSGKVGSAVENDAPLAPALRDALRSTDGAIRRLGAIGVRDADLPGAPNAVRLGMLLDKLARMPPGPVPTTRGGWQSFLAAVGLADTLDAVAPGVGSAMLAAPGGKWDDFEADALRQTAVGIVDVFRDFHRNVAMPAAMLGEIEWDFAATAAKLTSNRTFAQISAMSTWWHASRADVKNRLSTLHPLPGEPEVDKEWPPLHGSSAWTAPNGWTAHPLTDEDMLVEDGKELSFCVADYVPDAMYLGTHLVSFRNQDGERVATAEISQAVLLPLAGKGLPGDAEILSLPPSVAQFQAYKNDTPPIEAWAALWAYVGAIMGGELKLDEKLLTEGLARRRKLAAAILEVTTVYDASKPAAVMEAWNCYSPMLSKSVAKRGPAAFVGQQAAATAA